MTEVAVGSSMNIQDTIAENVVTQIADKEGASPTDLEPIHTVVDPDALEKLFQPVPGNERMSGQISFTYCGYNVTIQASGYVETTVTQN